MKKYDFEEIGFFDAFFGLITQPGETTNVLLIQKRPKYVLTLLFLIYLTLFGPALYYVWKFGGYIYKPLGAYGIMLTLSFAIIAFVFLEGVFLFLAGVNYTFHQLFALVAYCLTPLIAVFLLIYLFNYLSTGSLSFVSMLLKSATMHSDRFLRIVPYALVIAQLNILVVLTHGLRFLGELHLTTAIVFALISILPAYLSLMIGVFVANLALPGTKSMVDDFLASAAILMNF